MTEVSTQNTGLPVIESPNLQEFSNSVALSFKNRASFHADQDKETEKPDISQDTDQTLSTSPGHEFAHIPPRWANANDYQQFVSYGNVSDLEEIQPVSGDLIDEISSSFHETESQDQGILDLLDEKDLKLFNDLLSIGLLQSDPITGIKSNHDNFRVSADPHDSTRLKIGIDSNSNKTMADILTNPAHVWSPPPNSNDDLLHFPNMVAGYEPSSYTIRINHEV